MIEPLIFWLPMTYNCKNFCSTLFLEQYKGVRKIYEQAKTLNQLS